MQPEVVCDVSRIMRENGLQVRPLRRFVRTTDSDHDGPIFPNLAQNFVACGPDEMWVADITYVAIATGFVYLAVILDSWSRRVVGYGLARRIDSRVALAALRAAIAARRPPSGCIHHSDRGTQKRHDREGLAPMVRSASLMEQSDCVLCQAGGRVACSRASPARDAGSKK